MNPNANQTEREPGSKTAPATAEAATQAASTAPVPTSKNWPNATSTVTNGVASVPSVLFKTVPANGTYLKALLKRRITDEEFGTSAIKYFDTMSRGRINRVYVPKPEGAGRAEETYFRLDMHFAPGQHRGVLAFSQNAEILEKAALEATKPDSKIDYFNVIGHEITATTIKARNLPNIVRDTRSMTCEGLVAVMKDGSQVELIAIPGESLDA